MANKQEAKHILQTYQHIWGRSIPVKKKGFKVTFDNTGTGKEHLI